LLLDKLCSSSDLDRIVIFGPIKKMWTSMTEHLNVSFSSTGSSISEQSTLVTCAMLVSRASCSYVSEQSTVVTCAMWG